jgi:hypothetical protein
MILSRVAHWVATHAIAADVAMNTATAEKVDDGDRLDHQMDALDLEQQSGQDESEGELAEFTEHLPPCPAPQVFTFISRQGQSVSTHDGERFVFLLLQDFGQSMTNEQVDLQRGRMGAHKINVYMANGRYFEAQKLLNILDEQDATRFASETLLSRMKRMATVSADMYS